MKKIAYLFKTHKCNDTICFLLNELYRSKTDNVDIYILFNNTNPNIVKNDLNILLSKYTNVVTFDYKEIFNKYNRHIIHGSDFVGNEMFVLFDFYEKHKEYDYYFMTENDIWFNDVNIFNILNNSDKDVLYSYVESHDYNEPNYWLRNELPEVYKVIDKENYSYVMLQVIGITSNGLNQIINEYFNTNYCCHNEILIPSYIKKCNLSIDYLINYCKTNIKIYEYDIIPQSNTIYHPLKSLSKLKSTINALDKIDKIYCICLYEIENRLNNCKELQSKFNSDKFTIKYATKHNYYNEVYKQLNFDFPGQLGCAISHYEVINEAYHLGYNYIMICEDDICFDFDKLNLFLSNAPEDFDILQCYSLDLQLPDGVTITKEDLEKEYNNGIYWKNVSKECNRWGIQLYIISRKGMEYYLNMQSKKLNIADYPMICSYDNNINHYITTLKVVNQQDYQSEVSNY